LFDADGFVSKMNTFESTIRESGPGSEGKGSDLFCAKKACHNVPVAMEWRLGHALLMWQGALNVILTKKKLKEMLKEVLTEVQTSEEDRVKLKVPRCPSAS
jgi:hypothetical protein